LGSFTITKIEWGPSGYVHALDATFEYHCWGEAPAVRGQLHILNPPPPPVLKVGLTVAGHGTVSRPAHQRSCSKLAKILGLRLERRFKPMRAAAITSRTAAERPHTCALVPRASYPRVSTAR
jgi:hypothetical protein